MPFYGYDRVRDNLALFILRCYVLVISDAWRQRFGGTARLYGEKRCNCLLTRIFVWLVSVVSVLGGGSAGAHGDWRNHAYRYDDVCVTNTNRQIHALRDNVGWQKRKSWRNVFARLTRSAVYGGG